MAFLINQGRETMGFAYYLCQERETMGFAYYLCPKHLATYWWRVAEMGGVRVERWDGETAADVGGTVAGFDMTVGVLASMEAPDGESAGFYPRLMMTCGPQARELHACLEASFLVSGARLNYGKLRGCRRLLRCRPALARAWEHVLEDGQLDFTVSRGSGGAGVMQNAPIPYRSGNVRRPSATARVFAGPALDPETGEVTAYVAVDYAAPRFWGLSKKAECLAESIASRFIAHGASEVELD